MRFKRTNWAPADTRFTGSGPYASGQGAAGQAANSVLTRTIFPPWLYPLGSGQDFFVNQVRDGAGNSVKATPLAAAVGATVLSVPFIVPDNMKAVVRVAGYFIDAPTALTDIDWILRINEAPVQGWTLTTYPRAASNLSEDTSGVVRIPTGAVIDMLIINRAATGPFTVGCRFAGWYYSVLEAGQLWGDLLDKY